MEQVIVTVKRVNESRVRDIELGVDVPEEQLSIGLAQRLGWERDLAGRPIAYDVEAHHPSRKLRPDENLAQANTWDGAWLILHPRSESQAQPAPKGRGQGYVMKRIDVEDSTPDQEEPSGGHAASPTPPPPQTPDSSSGYCWKRIDED